jgi:proton-translocating NADH-quinone oxidoreductase chain L
MLYILYTYVIFLFSYLSVNELFFQKYFSQADYFLIIFFPIFIFFILFCFGRFIGKKGTLVYLCFIYFFVYFFFLKILISQVAPSLFLSSKAITSDVIFSLTLGTWIFYDTLQVDYCFVFDNLSLIMSFLVLTVSICVHLYSFEYMELDPHIIRFIAYLSLFTFFMLILILADNLILLFVGWEGVGLCSYLLISFWYTRLAACKAAIKAVLFNRIGDCSLLFAISLIFYSTNAVDFPSVFLMLPYVKKTLVSYSFFGFNLTNLDLIALFLYIAAMGKSAQFPFHVWLTSAMEGPTPVSALIHAATMVTAGVYLIIRCSYIIECSNFVLNIMSCSAIITIVFSSCAGLFQHEAKRIIAYSTCSQLGYMFLSCSFSYYHFALYHLINHGFFKALLFLCAGLALHHTYDEQDAEYSTDDAEDGFLYVYSYIATFVSLGMPYFSCYYSKDLILDILQVTSHGLSYYYICTFTLIISSMYSLAGLSDILNNTDDENTMLNEISYELSLVNIYVLGFLALFSMFSGYFFKDLFVGPGSTFFSAGIFINQYEHSIYNLVFLECLLPYKYISFLFTLSGILLSFGFYNISDFIIPHNMRFIKLSNFNNFGWYSDFIYPLLGKSLQHRAFFFFLVEKYFFELIGLLSLNYFIDNVTLKVTKYIKITQYEYIVSICYFILIILLILLFLF